MSEDFTQPSGELLRVAEEISLLRREIQMASAALGRIEKRLRVAFPNYPKAKSRSKTLLQAKSSEPNKSRDELMAQFEILLAATKENGDVGFSSEIDKLSPEDTIALAYELGVTGSRKMSLKKAQEGIRGRIQESLLLAYNRKENTSAWSC